MLYISQWQHICNTSDLTHEFFDTDSDGTVKDGLEKIMGNPEDCVIDWTIRHWDEKIQKMWRAGDGYLKFCPFCGSKLPQTHEEAITMYIRGN